MCRVKMFFKKTGAIGLGMLIKSRKLKFVKCLFSVYRPFTFAFYNLLETTEKVFLMPLERKWIDESNASSTVATCNKKNGK